MRKFCSVLAVFFLILTLVGCAVEEPISTAQPQWTTQKVYYKEAAGEYAFSVEMQCFDNFYFEAGVSENARSECMSAVTEIMAQLSASNAPTVAVYTEDTYDGVYIVENTLYTAVRNWQSAAFIIDVLLAYYGEFTHFGLVYGYANALASRLGWQTDSIQAVTVPENTDIYDLNYLCFAPKFTDEQDIMVAKCIAAAWVNRILEADGEDAVLTMLTSSEVCASLSAFYEALNISYAPSTLQYAYGGVQHGYAVRSQYATFYIGAHWQDVNVDLNPLVSENFLHGDYSEIKTFFQTNTEQMAKYQELFELTYYNNALTVILPNDPTEQNTSYYQSNNHRIYLINVDSLMHEYIHSLVQPTSSAELWESEGFARYFSYKYDVYGIAFLNQDYNNLPDSPAVQYVREYQQSIDRPIDMAIDYKELENIAVYSRSYKNPNKNYVTGSSFVQFLCNRYGEKAVIECVCAAAEFDEPYGELVQQWNAFIDTEYAQYSKYS